MPSSVPTVEEFREKATAKLAERKRAANFPSTKTKVILEKQRENLRKTINECARAEETRATKMERATTRDQRDKLESRFDNERNMDRHRIRIIQDDLSKYKSVLTEGKINDIDTRARARLQLEDAKLPARLDHEYHRFHGLETPVDFILHKATVVKEATASNAFQKKLIAMQPKFDMVHETKRLHLLQEKKQILKQVISVQQQAIMRQERAASEVVVRSGRDIAADIRNTTINVCQEHDERTRKMAQWKANKMGGGGWGVPQSARSRGSSASSVASRGSTASWASFHTTSAPKPVSRGGGGFRAARPAPKVPQLNLR